MDAGKIVAEGSPRAPDRHATPPARWSSCASATTPPATYADKLAGHRRAARGAARPAAALQRRRRRARSARCTGAASPRPACWCAAPPWRTCSCTSPAGRWWTDGRARLAVLESRRWSRYRRIWQASVFSSFILPVLFVLSIGIGVGGYVGGVDGVPLPGLHRARACSPRPRSRWRSASRPARCWATSSGAAAYHAMRATPVRIADMIGGYQLYILFRVLIAAVGVPGGQRGCSAPSTRRGWCSRRSSARCSALAVAAPTSASRPTIENDSYFALLFRFVVIPSTLFAGVFFPVDAAAGAAAAAGLRARRCGTGSSCAARPRSASRRPGRSPRTWPTCWPGPGSGCLLAPARLPPTARGLRGLTMVTTYAVARVAPRQPALARPGRRGHQPQRRRAALRPVLLAGARSPASSSRCSTCSPSASGVGALVGDLTLPTARCCPYADVRRPGDARGLGDVRRAGRDDLQLLLQVQVRQDLRRDARHPAAPDGDRARRADLGDDPRLALHRRRSWSSWWRWA